MPQAGPHTLLPDRPVIAVIGSGAVGAYYGSRLAQSGLDVHFLLRSDYDAVKAHGWQVESPVGHFSLQPNIHRHTQDMPKADLVLIALKTTSNDQYRPLLTPLLHDSTVLFTLQNGLGSDDLLAYFFGASRVMGGLCYVGINRAPPNVIRHLGNGLIKFGDYIESPGEDSTPRTRQIARLFTQAKIPVEILPSLKQGRWDKLLWNIPFNGLGAALDLTADRLIDNPAGLALVKQLMTEVWQAAHADGCTWPITLEDMVERQLTVTRNLPGYRTSMQIDRQENRPLELEAILGHPLRLGESLGVSMPTLSWLHELAKTVNPGRNSDASHIRPL